MSALQKVGDVLRIAVKDWKMETALRTRNAIEAWQDLVGEQIANASRPLRLHDATLYVAVSNSVWAQELRFVKKDLLERLNAHAGEPLFKDLRFEVRPSAFNEKIKFLPLLDLPAGIEVTINDTLRIEDLSKAVEDPDLRARFARLVLASYRWKLWNASRGSLECPICGLLYPSERPHCPVCVASRTGSRF